LSACFVLDASAALPWCFRDEASEAVNRLLKRLQTNEEALVPAHWTVEVGNALLVAIRRKRISREDVIRFLSDLEILPIQVRSTNHLAMATRLLPLAEKHGLSLYDTAYLQLALSERLPLATQDAQLARAAQSEGVALLL
jgi:predicted nucleic acid-binding protein